MFKFPRHPFLQSMVVDRAALLKTGGFDESLKVAEDTMALEVQRTYRLASGKIAQIAINTHPASRFRHSMTIRRVRK